jgi:hypothetical protein
MATVDEALSAIRHAVQDHGDSDTFLGSPVALYDMIWFGRILGWEWPRSYTDVLCKHNGTRVQDAIAFSFIESIECFLSYHDEWHRPDGYWPVSSDGCGNYYCLVMGRNDQSGECPVVFFEMISSTDQPQSTVAPNYAGFILKLMKEQCERVNCSR